MPQVRLPKEILRVFQRRGPVLRQVFLRRLSECGRPGAPLRGSSYGGPSRGHSGAASGPASGTKPGFGHAPAPHDGFHGSCCPAPAATAAGAAGGDGGGSRRRRGCEGAWIRGGGPLPVLQAPTERQQRGGPGVGKQPGARRATNALLSPVAHVPNPHQSADVAPPRTSGPGRAAGLLRAGALLPPSRPPTPPQPASRAPALLLPWTTRAPGLL